MNPLSPPTLLSTVSRKSHGSASSFDINLPLSAGSSGVEGRSGGPTTVILTFDQIMVASDGTPDCFEVTLSSGSCSSATITGEILTISMSGSSPNACLALTVAGLENLAGDDDVHVQVLLEDVDASGVVNILDQSVVKAQLFLPLTTGSFPADVDASSSVNILDQGQVKGNLFKSAPCP